jgi:hypothetical protein
MVPLADSSVLAPENAAPSHLLTCRCSVLQLGGQESSLRPRSTLRHIPERVYLQEDRTMWAQIIKTRVKPGKEAELERLHEQFRAAEQPGSGLVWGATMLDQKDPGAIYMMIVCESEEKARAREQDPRREPGLAAARETMAEIFEGPVEFVDLNVVAEHRG